MSRNPIGEMERAAARLLPKPPGVIVPGWFWEEWALVGVAVAIVCAVIYALC